MPDFVLRLAVRLAGLCNPLAVLVFGSWAQGRANAESDLDLIVVLARPAGPPVRAALLDALHSVPMHVDLLIWSEEELAAARADPHGFAGSVLSSAVVVHGALPALRQRA